jgi:hypothetical protein
MTPFTCASRPSGVIAPRRVLPSWHPDVSHDVLCECGGGGGDAWQAAHEAGAVVVAPQVGAGSRAPTPSWQYVPAHALVFAS